MEFDERRWARQKMTIVRAEKTIKIGGIGRKVVAAIVAYKFGGCGSLPVIC